jgi:predicted nucleotidyltransferase component of viral defense system
LKDRPTLQELVEVQRQFGLQTQALVEKDWFVVRALAAITSADQGPFQLVFQGGTALSRAHRLIERMSEDIDFKIVAAAKQPRAAYRRLRAEITRALLSAGFEFDPKNEAHCRVMYESTYTLFQLPYAPLAERDDALRAEIQIEISSWPMRRPAVDRTVTSFVAEAYKHAPEVPAVACADLAENAAEKFVAVTRRAGAQFAGVRKKRDPTLVRHIYDLHMLERHVDPADVAALASIIMQDDAQSRGNQFPAYGENPLRETLKAVEGMAADPAFADEYADFVGRIVYGQVPAFEAAMATLNSLADQF